MPQQHTTEDQVKFMSQWFMSWSEMQREDFLPVLMQAYQPKDHLNGLVGGYDSLSIRGRRPSLFDCQVKLFHDWFGAWTESERQSLLEQLREVDPDFMAQYEKRLSGEVTQDEVTQPDCVGEEGQNPPSSVSSPPSTLPRSHSPHDSGLDEPPMDNEQTDPHSLDSSQDTEDTATATEGQLNNAVTPQPTGKIIIDSAMSGEVSAIDDLTNGLAESKITAEAEVMVTPSVGCEAVAEH